MSYIRKAAKLAAVALSLTLIAGCSSSTSDPAPGGDGQKELLFGAALPLTGGLSPEGKKQQSGIELWEETLNDSGGIEIDGEKYKVRVKIYDYESDTPTAVKLVEKLITEDRASYIIGPLGSGAAKAVSSVTERYEIPMIAPSASASEVFDQGYKYLFGVLTPNSSLTDPLVQIAKDNGVKSVAIISRNDLFPISIGNALQESATAAGLEIVSFDEFPIGTTDFSGPVTNLRSSNPDWVFASGYTEDLVPLTKQLKQLGISSPMISMIAAPAYKEYVESVGDAANGISSAAWWFNTARFEGIDVFGTAGNYTDLYEQKFGSIPDYGIASVSAAGVIFTEAMRACGCTDPKEVRDALADFDDVTFYGPIKFDASGQNVGLEPPIFQIQDGKQVVVLPEDIADGEFQFPAW